jgi:uncharacterized protein
MDLTGDELKNITLFGGEPLLPKNKAAIEYIMSIAPDKDYTIFTNGYYLEEYITLLKTVNVILVNVTLDGEEEIHDKRRCLEDNKPTFRKIVNGITKCLENNISVCVRMNLDLENFESGLKLREALLEEHVEQSNLISFELAPMLESLIDEKNKVLCDSFISDLDYKPKDRFSRNKIVCTMSPIINSIVTNTPLKPTYSFCYAHDTGFVVDPYGCIFPCLRAVGVNELAIGRFYPTIEFEENSIRNRNIENIHGCRECIYSLLCGGGCPVSLNDYSDVFKPECNTIMNQIHSILPAFIAEEEKWNKKHKYEDN